VIVAEVVGSAWATVKHPSLNGRRLLLVRPIDPVSGKASGEAFLAVDAGTGAGPGGAVLIVDEGGSARQMLGDAKAPVRAVICGIVDSVRSGGLEKKYG
jgi:ethanolamine utilization protein EutN